jgi:protein SCO1/2
MNGLTRRQWLATLTASPLVGAAAVYATSGQAGAEAAASCGAPAKLTARERMRLKRLPNVPLITHEGRHVRFYDDLIKDRKVAINFMYANCEGICVPTTRNLLGAQKLLDGRVGRDIFFYSITLKPQEDTPEVLARYAALYDVGPGWKFLTGDPADIELLRRSLGFASSNPVEDRDVSNHIGIVRLVVEPAARWGHTVALSPPKHIVRSIHFTFDSPTVSDVPTYVEG